MRNFKKYIKECIITFIRPFVKMKNNVVIFSGFRGEYSDNPKYIAETLHRKNKDINIYWALGSPSESRNIDIPDYINILYTNTFEYFVKVNQAKVLVDNYYGFFLSEKPRIHDYLLKNKNQYNISTWHGTPLKKIGGDAVGSKLSKKIFSTTDLVIAGCKYTKEKLNSAYVSRLKKPVDIKLTGTPRNDVLVNGITDTEKSNIKEKLGIPARKRVVIFAPTFRDEIENSGLAQLRDIDIIKLLEALKNIIDDEWCFVFRVHHEVANNTEVKKIMAENHDNIIDGNSHMDMAEYLSVADCLITDYSGSMFDFFLTEKPCFLYALDYENYKLNERGFYLDINQLPCTFAKNFEELLNDICSFKYNEYKSNVRKFMKSIGNMEDGLASERISDIIIDKLE